MNITIIIPIKLNDKTNLDDFTNYIITLTEDLDKDIYQIIIADESNKNIFDYLDQRIDSLKNVVHFVPSDNLRSGDNDKLNGVYAALEYVKHDKVLLIDDHYRVSRKTLLNIDKAFNDYDCFKMMPIFNRFPLSVLVDMCGMFIINILDSRKQYCGHLAFRKSHIDYSKFPRNALFDELAIEQQLRNSGYSIGFIKDIAIEAIQDISLSKFFEQRVRYAYENMAIPFRFLLYASILPILIFLFVLNARFAFYLMIILTFGVTLIGGTGQVIYGSSLVPIYTFLLSPIWFWFYPFTTWISVFRYFRGGVMFGGKMVKRAI